MQQTRSSQVMQQLERSGARSESAEDAAKQFEALMLQEILKTMRATVPSEDKGFAMGMASDMFDQAVADSAAGGLGLAPILAREFGGGDSSLTGPTSLAPLPPRPPGPLGVSRATAAYAGAAPAGKIPHGRPRTGAILGIPQPGMDPVEGIVSSEYGWRVHPISGKRKFHEGVDVAAPEGTEIRAVQAGKVRYAGRRGGYGNVVELEHADGSITKYAHASRIHVRRGDRVEVGEAIADVGSTGHSTGPHLHFEVRVDGKAVNPTRYLARLRGE